MFELFPAASEIFGELVLAATLSLSLVLAATLSLSLSLSLSPSLPICENVMCFSGVFILFSVVLRVSEAEMVLFDLILFLKKESKAI